MASWGLRAIFAVGMLAAVMIAVQCNSHHDCSISGSSYDQSCTQSSDCVVEPAGDFCSCGCVCSNTAINVRAQKQYESDLANAMGCAKACPCPFQGYPVCAHGTCGITSTLDAGTD